MAAPAGLAVIGADDIPTARLAAPPLTTVCFDLHQAGRRRAEAVVASLSGREPGLTPALHDPQVMQVIQRSST